MRGRRSHAVRWTLLKVWDLEKWWFLRLSKSDKDGDWLIHAKGTYLRPRTTRGWSARSGCNRLPPKGLKRDYLTTRSSPEGMIHGMAMTSRCHVKFVCLCRVSVHINQTSISPTHPVMSSCPVHMYHQTSQASWRYTQPVWWYSIAGQNTPVWRQ